MTTATVSDATPASVTRSSSGTTAAVEVEGLTKRYGDSRALDQLDLAVPWDQRVALLGPNGAGKTTLIRILATLVRPTSGTVRVGGLPLPKQAGAVRRHVGYVAHQTFLYDELSVSENLTFYGRLHGVPGLTTRVAILLEQLGLADRASDRVRTLSRGLQQRAALARAVLHDPAILLLDEPETGLDVDAPEILRSLLLDQRGRPRTVILATHQVDRAIELVDRIVVVALGKIVLDVSSDSTTAAEVAQAIRQARAAP